MKYLNFNIQYNLSNIQYSIKQVGIVPELLVYLIVGNNENYDFFFSIAILLV